jgi:predicted methyltransferase
MRTRTLAAAVFALAFAAGATASADSTRADLERAIASPKRSEANRARDAHRHPKETLEFFGLRSDQHVLELWPGGGWYTEILAETLGAGGGSLAVTNFDPNGPQDQPPYRFARELANFLAADSERFGAVKVIEIAPPERLSFGEPASYDLIVTFRNNHTWLNGGYHDAVYREAFRALKPGGVLGVTQHRANAGADPKISAKTGYVAEAAVIDAAVRAGFELAARSEINANPRDTKDYPDGVWTLPPAYRLGEKDRERYAAIGESDRMTLRFVKPAGAAAPAR